MMKYYTKPDGTMTAYYKEGFTEVENPIFNGQPLPDHKNIGQVEADDEGNLYSLYNEDGTANTDKINEAKEEAEYQEWLAMETKKDTESLDKANRKKYEEDKHV